MSNNTDDILSQLQKSLSVAVEDYKVSNESIENIVSFGFLGALAVVGWGVPAFSKWRENRKKKKEFEQSELGKLKKTLEGYNKTILNNGWLNKQSFVQGHVTVPGAEVLLINNKLPSNPLDAIKDSFKTMVGFEQVILPDYNSYVKSIIDITKPIEDTWNSFTEEKYLALTDDQKDKLAKLQDDVDDKLGKLIHPMVKNANRIPDHKTIVGNLRIDLESLRSSGGLSDLVASIKPNTDVKELPALTKDQVKYAGLLLKEIADFRLNNKAGLFSKVFDVIDRIPMPQDGWPYESISGLDVDDVFPGLAMGKFGDIGALNEQGIDPIYGLAWEYEKILGNLQTVLVKWIEASITK